MGWEYIDRLHHAHPAIKGVLLERSVLPGKYDVTATLRFWPKIRALVSPRYAYDIGDTLRRVQPDVIADVELA